MIHHCKLIENLLPVNGTETGSTFHYDKNENLSYLLGIWKRNRIFLRKKNFKEKKFGIIFRSLVGLNFAKRGFENGAVKEDFWRKFTKY